MIDCSSSFHQVAGRFRNYSYHSSALPTKLAVAALRTSRPAGLCSVKIDLAYAFRIGHPRASGFQEVFAAGTPWKITPVR